MTPIGSDLAGSLEYAFQLVRRKTEETSPQRVPEKIDVA